MAFNAAAGYGNLPQGNWSPVVYSKKVQLAFRRKSVIREISNTDYMGEIADAGDTVQIIKEPDVEVRRYARGQKVTPQDLDDTAFLLVVDQGNYFAFHIDDIEKSMSHVNWESMASNQAAYKLSDGMDREVLGYLAGFEYNGSAWVARTTFPGTKADIAAGNDELLAINKLFRNDFVSGGSATDSVVVGTDGSYDTTPLRALGRMARLLDEQNVPTEGRWAVVDPVFKEMLLDEDSKFVNNDYAANQNAGGLIRNGRFTNLMARGFELFESNNLPFLGTGPDTVDADGSSANYGVIVAGHRSAVATAETITKTEVLRAQDTFGDIVRGMHVFGRKILRPEGLTTLAYNIGG